MNPGTEDYVVMVLAGYNYDIEPAPLKIYVGKKGVNEDNQLVDQSDANTSERDKFLARNGLLYGKIYGMAAMQPPTQHSASAAQMRTTA